MTSKLVVNTIEADTGISSVSFASSISMNSSAKFHFSAAGIDIGADTNINRPASGTIGFNINSGEKIRITSNGRVGIGTNSPTDILDVYSTTDPTIRSRSGSSSVGANIEVCGGASNDSQLILSSGTTSKYQIFRDGSQSDDLRIYDSTNSLDIIRYRHGGYLHFGVNGAERLRIDANGDINLGNNPTNQYGYKLNIQDTAILYAQTASSNGTELKLNLDHGNTIATFGTVSTSHLAFVTANTERLRIDSVGAITVQSALTGNTALAYLRNTRTRASGNKYGIEFRDSVNEANANIVIQQNSSGNNAAEMKFYVNGGTGGNGLENGNHILRLKQNKDVEIPDGNLVIGTSGHGIDFAATSDSSGTNASELLDDYEEGSFTPRLAPSSSYASIHENGIGRYTKIGNMVTCTMHWINKNGTAFPTGQQIIIYNLPYTIIHTGNNGDAHYVAMSQMMHNVQFGQQHKHYFYSNHNTTTIRGLKSLDGAVWQIWTCADWNQASLYFDTSITYMTTS